MKKSKIIPTYQEKLDFLSRYSLLEEKHRLVAVETFLSQMRERDRREDLKVAIFKSQCGIKERK